ncbi:hypothetical protein [Nocardia sp. NPDC004415]
MADVYEFSMTVDLRDSLSTEEVAQLRRHLGLGEFSGDESSPEPLLGSHEPAWKIGGMLGAALERTPDGWHLEARQEVHPENFADLAALMRHLYLHVAFDRVAADGSVELARLRWYEDNESTPLLVRDGQVFWPE